MQQGKATELVPPLKQRSTEARDRYPNLYSRVLLEAANDGSCSAQTLAYPQASLAYPAAKLGPRDLSQEARRYVFHEVSNWLKLNVSVELGAYW